MHQWAVLLAACFSLCISLSARGGEQCDGWLNGPLHAQPQLIEGIVLCSAVWTPSIGPPLLVIGGSFTSVGGVVCNNIAAWDGASWRALGAGANSAVQALAVYNGELIAGGYFTVMDNLGINFIARYNGVEWKPIVGPGGAGILDANFPEDTNCRALTVFNGELIVAGAFTLAGGVSAKNIARWNGTSWAGFANGLFYNNPQEHGFVNAVAVFNNVLYGGGHFDRAGAVAAANIARWNGSSWSALGIGVDSHVQELAVFNNELAVGGLFTHAGGIATNYIARWSGASWNAYGNGMPLWVEALQVYNGQLIAGTWSSGGMIRAWNGSTWSALGGGLTGAWCLMLGEFNGRLIAGGGINTAGSAGVAVSNIAQYSAAEGWSALQAPQPQTLTYETLGTRLIAAGVFTQSTSTSTPANNIVGWDGANLSRIATTVGGGEGTNGAVRALKSYTTAGPLGSRVLIVGGDFTIAGGLSANRVASYVEPSQTPATWSAMGAGFNGPVYALERSNNIIYAGGFFTTSGATTVNRIAQWTGSAWIAMGIGMNGSVYALRSYNGSLFAGGDFTFAGGVSSGGLARWNGTSWQPVAGGFFNGIVLALEVHNNELVIAGLLPGLAGSPNIIKYDGNAYTTLGSGGANNAVTRLKSNGTHLFVSGAFTSAGGQSANHLARWSAADGWSTFGGGVDEPIEALAVYHDELQAGLGIQIALNPAPSPGKGWVRYTFNNIPWVAQQPLNQSLNCYENATFTVKPATGYVVGYSWRRNGIPLVNGPTGHNNSILGVNSPTLTVYSVHAVDAASYDCVISHYCGSVTSSAATLTTTCCAGDVNGDGVVAVPDLLAVMNGWGACPIPPTLTSCPADIAPAGTDGAVNVVDLLLTINSWGACP